MNGQKLSMLSYCLEAGREADGKEAHQGLFDETSGLVCRRGLWPGGNMARGGGHAGLRAI